MMSNLQKMKQILISSAFITMETKHIRNIRRGFGSNSIEIDPDVIDTFIGYDAPYTIKKGSKCYLFLFFRFFRFLI